MFFIYFKLIVQISNLWSKIQYVKKYLVVLNRIFNTQRISFAESYVKIILSFIFNLNADLLYFRDHHTSLGI